MARKPAMASSFKHRIDKVLRTINTETFRRGFSNIDMWADTGNFALNRLLSNRYDRAFLYGRSVNIYGVSGSGKSLLLAQTAGIEQKKRNAFVFWVDVEAATDDKEGEKWLQRAGIDTGGNFDYESLATFNDAQAFVSSIAQHYRKEVEDYRDGKSEEAPPPMFVIFDSFSAMLTESQYEYAKKGEMKGDQGQKAKQLGDFILKAGHLARGLPILFTGVHHVYDNQEMINGKPVGGKHKLTGGNKPVYMASQSLLLSMKQLRDTDDKSKTLGITSTAKVLKCRFSKPFEEVAINIPYGRGIDPYSGLFDLVIQDSVVTSPSQGWYQFVRPDGSIQKFQRNSFLKYADEIMALPIKDEAPGVDLAPKELQDEIEADEKAIEGTE